MDLPMRRWFFVVVLLALSLVLIYTVDLSQEGLVKWQNAIQDKWSELAQESSPDGTDSDDNDTTGDTPESPSSSDGAISTPTIVEGQTLVTMKNPKETDPTFEWGPPMPLVSPEEAKHYLKEDKGDRWLPHRIRQHVKMREKPVRVVSVFAIDCELDILEIRLMELYDVVDYFVIGESNYSQVGFAKRLHFWESRHRFERFWPKIRHLVFWEGFKPQVAKDEWHNEVHTRGWLAQGLRGLADDDLVIVTDADEIPTRDAVMFWRTFTGYPEHSKLFVRWSQMGFFWHVTKYGGMWGPVASLANYKLVKEIGTNGVRQAHGGGDWWPLGSHQVIAGWHCSWCFPSQDFINKFRNVIEPFWRQGSKLPEYSEEAMAQARYDGTIIGDPPFEMDHSNHPQAVTNHFRYMADREVRPGCGWCRRPESDSFNPIEHIQPTDPVPQDLVERSRKCSNDVTRAYTPHGPDPQRRR